MTDSKFFLIDLKIFDEFEWVFGRQRKKERKSYRERERVAEILVYEKVGVKWDVYVEGC